MFWNLIPDPAKCVNWKTRSAHRFAHRDYRTCCNPRPATLLPGPSRYWIPRFVYLGTVVSWLDIGSREIQNFLTTLQPKSSRGNCY